MTNSRFQVLLAAVAFAATIALFTGSAAAHCDALDGPVVTAARDALRKGNVTPVLMWVKKEHEKELRSAFTRTLEVRKLNARARELADTYFFETLVRLHRAGEGAPYTGLRAAGAGATPAVKAADHALAKGSADVLTHKLTDALRHRLLVLFERARKARSTAAKDVESGREYVEAYVAYVHFVEALERLVQHAEHATREHRHE